MAKKKQKDTEFMQLIKGLYDPKGDYEKQEIINLILSEIAKAATQKKKYYQFESNAKIDKYVVDIIQALENEGLIAFDIHRCKYTEDEKTVVKYFKCKWRGWT